MVKKRRRHTAAYKFRIALKALEGSQTISQLSSQHEIHANPVRAWKRQLLQEGPSVFARNGERKQREQEAQEAELNEQMAAARPLRIGRLKMELERPKKGNYIEFQPNRLTGIPTVPQHMSPYSLTLLKWRT